MEFFTATILSWRTTSSLPSPEFPMNPGQTVIKFRVIGIRRGEGVIVVFLKGKRPSKTPHLPFLHGNSQRAKIDFY
jgi:hypothetical protein